MGASAGGFAGRPDVARFAELMAEELDRSEARDEDLGGETVEDLLFRLLDEAGAVFQGYVEDDPRDLDPRTERACARVAVRAMMIADVAGAERRRRRGE